MKFLERLKKDFKFRVMFVVIIMLLFMGLNSQANQKQWQDQAVCDQYNLGGYIVLTDSLTNCKASGCFVQYSAELPGIIGTITDLVTWQFRILGVNADNKLSTCVNAVPNGYYVLAISKDEAIKQCLNGDASDRVKDLWFTDEDPYMCRAGDPAQACQGNEKNLAEMAFGMGLPRSMGCAPAYYLVLFGGGMILLMLIGVML